MSNKPIIICNFYDLRDDIFIDGNVAVSCKNEKEIKKIIEKIEHESLIKNEDIEKFIEEYFHKLDGKASERIGNEILKIVQNQ